MVSYRRVVEGRFLIWYFEQSYPFGNRSLVCVIRNYGETKPRFPQPSPKRDVQQIWYCTLPATRPRFPVDCFAMFCVPVLFLRGSRLQRSLKKNLFVKTPRFPTTEYMHLLNAIKGYRTVPYQLHTVPCLPNCSSSYK